MSVIEVRDLSLRRGDRPVLHDVGFETDEGEILVVMGPSGSGKSSLLRCINRLTEPAPNTIYLHNQDITTLEVTELRRRVGMIFQKTAVFEGSIADNIRYGPSLHDKTLSNERITDLLEAVALNPELIDRPANELSGGQEQRMAIARALANKPNVLLLDEPTSSLDPIAMRHVEESLLALRRQLNLTMIWVSHSVEQTRRVGDRVLLLEQGHVVSIGDVATMFDEENGDKQILAFASGCDSECENGREEETEQKKKTPVKG